MTRKSEFKYVPAMALYSIKHPNLGIEFIRFRYNRWKDSKTAVYKFESTNSEIKDVIKKYFSESDYSLESLEENLAPLRKHISDFLQNLKKEPPHSKKNPYLTEYLLDDKSGILLYLICKLLKPEKVVETGVAYGVSSSYILQALHENNRGKLYSIDYSFLPWESREMIGAIIPDELRYRWDFVYGISSKKLKPLLSSIDQIDIFYHDSDHTYKNMMFEFNTAWPVIRTGGLLITDDVAFNNSFHDFYSKEARKPTIFSVGPLREPRIGIIQK